MADTTKQLIDPRNPLDRLDSRVGMHLAFWAYPQSDVKKANEIAPYPEHWQHAKPGVHLPPDWIIANQDSKGNLVKGSPEGWNTQHNEAGKLENQFLISINRDTKEITFDFKGSDAWSNWVSDLANAGASEFAKIQKQAQTAFDEVRKNPNYKDYRFAATGHSLGGGMAQSFALKNDMDVYVYNSLPIARDTIKGDYFKALGGYDAAIARYKSAGHQVHDVRTPNDIATYNYDKFMQNEYLSERTGTGHTMLPGSSLPAPIKTALMLGGYSTPVATAIMGKDHTMGAMFNGQHGLSVDGAGQYRIPEGHHDFAQLTPEARKLFIKLSESPVVKAQVESDNSITTHTQKFMMTHEDGGRQQITVYRHSGDVEIDFYNKDGRRTLINMNPSRGRAATATEFETDNQTPVKTEKIALYTDGRFQEQALVAKTSLTESQPQRGTGLWEHLTTGINGLSATDAAKVIEHIYAARMREQQMSPASSENAPSLG